MTHRQRKLGMEKSEEERETDKTGFESRNYKSYLLNTVRIEHMETGTRKKTVVAVKIVTIHIRVCLHM